MLGTTTVGGRLRQARKRGGHSLADIAAQAEMSISTLSRIETDKQPLEVETLILLARILGIDPAILISSGDADVDAIDPVIRQLRVLDREERRRLWEQLADSVRSAEDNGRSRSRELSMEVEELLAQLDYLRAEIESVKKRIQ